MSRIKVHFWDEIMEQQEKEPKGEIDEQEEE